MTDQDRSDREDVDPADALGGAGGLPLPDGQPRGAVPADRDEPGGEAAPEATDPTEETEPTDEPGTGAVSGDVPRP